MRRTARAAAALALGAAAVLVAAPTALAADDITIGVVIPGSEGLTVGDAKLSWAMNREAGSGAYFGGCNFLSAGVAGDAGSSRLWTADDYAATSGNVQIVKPRADGQYELATWQTKCLDPSGRSVTTLPTEVGSGNRVEIVGGQGTVDPDEGTATIRWEGSFTVVFYGGMTYWSASDPVLTVDADGTGALTATASGYGADMEDPSKWERLTPTTITLARLTGVTLGEDGFTVTPDYLGVAVAVPSGYKAQSEVDAENRAYWGSFPQDFVDFQLRTGQSSYWYTSGGGRDAAKPALPLTISYDASRPLPPVTPPGGSAVAAPSNPLNPAPGGSSAAGRAVPAAAPPALPVTGGVLGTTGGPFPAASAATVVATSALIPALVGSASWFAREGEQVLWAVAGVLTVSVVGALGLLKGWLVLPWTRPGP